MGCVFYQLFYLERAPWLDRSYVRDERPLKIRHSEHTSRIYDATAKRRRMLKRQKRRNAEDEFEYLILRMLDTNPKKRVDAKEARRITNNILKKLLWVDLINAAEK